MTKDTQKKIEEIEAMIDEAAELKKMNPSEAREFFEELHGGLEIRLAALREDRHRDAGADEEG